MNNFFLFNRDSFKRYFHNTAWLFLGKGVEIILSLAVGIYIARYLGPSDYGVLNYALTVVGIFSFLVNLGMENVLVKELVQRPGERDALLGTAFIVKLVGAILSILIIGVIFFLANEDPKTKFFIYIIAAGQVFQAFSVIVFYFQAKVLSKIIVIAQIIQSVIVSLLRAYFIFIQADLYYFVISYLMDGLLFMVGMWLVYARFGHSLSSWKFDQECFKSLMRQCAPLAISSCFIALHMKIDQVFIKYMLGNYAVGQYSVSVRLSEFLSFFPLIICASLFPAILNAKKQDRELYCHRIQNLTDIMFYLSLLLAAGLSFFSKPLILFFYGVEYAQAASVFSIYVWSIVPVFVGIAGLKFLITEELNAIVIFKPACGLVVNIIMNFLLIPAYGILGAAISTLLSYFCSAIVSNVFFKESRIVFVMFLRSLNPFRLMHYKNYLKLS